MASVMKLLNAHPETGLSPHCRVARSLKNGRAGMHAPLFRLPCTLHSNRIARFRMDTIEQQLSATECRSVPGPLYERKFVYPVFCSLTSILFFSAAKISRRAGPVRARDFTKTTSIYKKNEQKPGKPVFPSGKPKNTCRGPSAAVCLLPAATRKTVEKKFPATAVTRRISH